MYLSQTQGFLGNPEAEHFDWLSCSLRVRGGASDLLVVRKKGTVTVRETWRHYILVYLQSMYYVLARKYI